MSVARRFSGPGQPYEGLVRIGRDGKAKAQWNGVVRLVPEMLAKPLSWRQPRKVFVNSMSDLFHEGLAFEDIAAIFGVMAAAPQHTFQVLTKRPERARAFFEWIKTAEAWGDPDRNDPIAVLCSVLSESPAPFPSWVGEEGEPLFDAVREADWPLPNVWLGTSVEDQASADERIPHLLACPAAVRWVSYEPAIGPVNFGLLGTLPASMTSGAYVLAAEWLRWIVVGGESGPGARPFDLAWARSTIAQCRGAGVPCFVKQLGASPRVWTGERGDTPDVFDLPELCLRDRKGGDMSEWPEDLRVREWPEVSRG